MPAWVSLNIGLNTYGAFSVNNITFNQDYGDEISYPRETRNVVVTALRVQNLLLLVAGYTTRFKTLGGCVRILSGAAMGGVTLAVGKREVKKGEEGAIIGHWVDEALLTGSAQIGRGILEAFIPYGWIVNASLDVVATPINMISMIEHSLVAMDYMKEEGYSEPHFEPRYGLPLLPLYLV